MKMKIFLPISLIATASFVQAMHDGPSRSLLTREIQAMKALYSLNMLTYDRPALTASEKSSIYYTYERMRNSLITFCKNEDQETLMLDHTWQACSGTHITKDDAQVLLQKLMESERNSINAIQKALIHENHIKISECPTATPETYMALRSSFNKFLDTDGSVELDIYEIFDHFSGISLPRWRVWYFFDVLQQTEKEQIARLLAVAKEIIKAKQPFTINRAIDAITQGEASSARTYFEQIHPSNRNHFLFLSIFADRLSRIPTNKTSPEYQKMVSSCKRLLNYSGFTKSTHNTNYLKKIFENNEAFSQILMTSILREGSPSIRDLIALNWPRDYRLQFFAYWNGDINRYIYECRLIKHDKGALYTIDNVPYETTKNFIIRHRPLVECQWYLKSALQNDAIKLRDPDFRYLDFCKKVLLDRTKSLFQSVPDALFILKHSRYDYTKDRNSRGQSLLHVAASENSIPLAQELIRRGADLFAQTVDGRRTPLDYSKGAVRSFLLNKIRKRKLNAVATIRAIDPEFPAQIINAMFKDNRYFVSPGPYYSTPPRIRKPKRKNRSRVEELSMDQRETDGLAQQPEKKSRTIP